MPGLTALLLATPLFGLSLTPPLVPGVGPSVWAVELAPTLSMPGLLQDADAVAPPTGEAAPLPAEPPSSGSTTTAHIETPEDVAQAAADRQYTQDVMRRRELGQIHRAMGIATWIAMTGNLVIGLLQYNDRYGWGAGIDQNPCTSGHGIILGECTGTPWAHVVSASLTTTLYAGTFVLSLSMPDPNDADEGSGAFAEHLRIHEILRWIHSIGMLAQIVIGALLSNGVFGDRANHYDTMAAMAAVHQTIGWVTWGALTGAAAVMLF